jgi:hypothetical protein
VIAELVRPEATIGEAVMRAKHLIPDADFIATYNLLGDPALPVALPRGAIVLTAANGEGGRIHIGGEVKVSDFSGPLTVDLIGERGEVLRSATLEVAAPRFTADIPTSAEEFLAVRGVRAYAWNAARGLEAAGGIEFTGNMAQRNAAITAAAGGAVPP